MAESKAKPWDEKCALLLLDLLARPGGGAFQNDLSPEPKPVVRAPLVKAGLVRVEKRGRRNWIEVTDKGWHHAGEDLASLLPTQVSGTTAVLRAWLVHLAALMTARDIALHEMFAASPEAVPVPPSVPEPAAGSDLAARIRAAYLEVTGGRLNTRALLKDIRLHLPDVSRETLDEALLVLQGEQKAILQRLDNNAAATDADRAAALHIAGEPRHILWIPA